MWAGCTVGKMAGRDLPGSDQQHLFYGRQPVVRGPHRTGRRGRLDVSCGDPGTRLGAKFGTVGCRHRHRNRLSPMGRFFLGSVLLWRSGPMDSAASPGHARVRSRFPGRFSPRHSSGRSWCPYFRFWQPIFTLQQPYWIGFLVHLSSASMYPLYAWLRRSPEEKRSFKGRGFLQLGSRGGRRCRLPGGSHPVRCP